MKEWECFRERERERVNVCERAGVVCMCVGGDWEFWNDREESECVFIYIGEEWGDGEGIVVVVLGECTQWKGDDARSLGGTGKRTWQVQLVREREREIVWKEREREKILENDIWNCYLLNEREVWLLKQ